MTEEQIKELQDKLALANSKIEELTFENKVKEEVNSRWVELMKNKQIINETKEEPKKVFVSKYNKNIGDKNENNR